VLETAPRQRQVWQRAVQLLGVTVCYGRGQQVIIPAAGYKRPAADRTGAPTLATSRCR
jgi:hypothetical protein